MKLWCQLPALTHKQLQKDRPQEIEKNKTKKKKIQINENKNKKQKTKQRNSFSWPEVPFQMNDLK